MRKRNLENDSEMMMVNDTQMESIPTNYEKLHILRLMEMITEKAANKRLSDEFFEQVLPLSTHLGNLLGLTPQQAVLYSIFIDNYNDNMIGLNDIQQQTGARMTRLAQLQDDIDAIDRKRVIRRSGGLGYMANGGVHYNVPIESIKALRDNKAYSPKPLANLPFGAFVREVDKCVGMRYDLGEPYELLAIDLDELVKNNMHLKICKALTELQEKLELVEANWVLLVVLCVFELCHEENMSLSRLRNIFEDDMLKIIQVSFDSEANVLLQAGLVEFGCNNGMVDRNILVLSRKAKNMLLSERRRRGRNTGVGSLKDSKRITTKSLFYEDGVKQQVDRLNDMLTKSSFKDICKRLKENKMRRGFTCLFYGAPGTGKTETVLQLAKKTGRSIMQVDLSEIKDKYVGESEKNVKAIFDNYRAAIESEKICPILLFNEADAIIGKRLENVEHSVDNMFNSMQNIILQEMETFEGILIATTNLEGNMDSAFERRFLYKVRFEKPSVSVRKQIWQSIIPSLSEEVALSLANEFDFSGGQIENIARKQIVDNILYGESSDVYASLKQYCNDESIQNRNTRPSIGFMS